VAPSRQHSLVKMRPMRPRRRAVWTIWTRSDVSFGLVRR
jgi:hypothetical protein